MRTRLYAAPAVKGLTLTALITSSGQQGLTHRGLNGLNESSLAVRKMANHLITTVIVALYMLQ